MQLTSQTATKSAGPANGLMNLTYGYQASAGQMGAGSKAGNAGQLMSISGTIGGVTESAAHTYDDLGRLVTSNQTSNGASAQRRFAYDRWGNRTGMWDATSGGTQIQSITLQQSGGAPINQIASVTTTATLNYAYDAVGNVINDGVHSYTYDSVNRLVSVDGGSTGSYSYDHQNRRYKKAVGSTVTHYLWQGSQVMAEHNGNTGAVLNDYIFFGARMIANGGGQFFLNDRLSTRLVLDSSGNVIGRQGHLPFGEDFGESGTQEKHHFTSYERDSESGTDYAVNRQYAQSVGRFARVDPYIASWSQIAPQAWNRYGYVQNDSVNAGDPLGLFPFINFPIMLPPYVVNISGGGGGIIPGAGGGTVHGPLLDGDESGVGRGVGGEAPEVVTQQPSDEQKKKFRDFLKNLSQKCKDKLAKLDSKILDKLSNAIGEVKITDTNSIKDRKATDFMTQQVIDIVLAANAAGDNTRKYGSMTVGQLFTPGFVPEAYGGTPAVLTVPLAYSNSIPGIYAPGGLSHPLLSGDNFNINMTHELLHYVTGNSDTDLQNALGTGGKDVSDWLKNGCPP